MPDKSSHKINWLKTCVPFALASAAVLGSSASAGAATFNFSYAPGTTLEQMIGYEVAGQIWSTYLSDPVTVNLYIQGVKSKDLPDKVIGGALPGIVAQQSFDKYRQGLTKEAKSLVDFAVTDNLNGADFDVVLKGNTKNDELKGIKKLNLTRANAKAVNGLFYDSNSSALDGFIVINNLDGQSVSWHYDVLNGTVASNKLDFLSVAVHELGHQLGFTSGVDNANWLATVTDLRNGNRKDIKNTDMTYSTALDLFRFSVASAAQGRPDMEIGGEKKFLSVNGGAFLGCEFSTGKSGDGFQGSHWKRQGNSIGIMDAALTTGTRRSISNCDLQAMDAIGWDLQSGSINMSNILNQSKQRLASKIGVTTAWLDANSTEAATRLSKDRSQDVDRMVQDSEVYEWGSRNCQPGQTGCWRQEGFWQNVLWDTLDDEPTSEATAKPVPEPSSIAGLAGMMLLGIGSLFKSRNKK